MPHVRQDAVSDEVWKRAEELHKKLAKQDEPVKLLMAKQFSAYYENFDVPLQEACCKDLLQQRWTFKA